MLLCRLCLKLDTPMQNVLYSGKKYADLTLIESIYWIFGVEIDVNDPYSKFICNRCENVVQYVGSYRTLFLKNQSILQGRYDSEDEAEWINEVMVSSRKLPDDEALDISDRDDLIAKARTRRWEFIDYYYNMPTTAIRDLIRSKEHKTDSPKSDTKSLVEVNEVVKVEVCKYCSKIFRSKYHLNRHYTTKHRSLKMIERRLGREKCKNDIAKLLRRKRSSSLFDATKFPNLNYMKQLDLFTSSQKATNGEENVDFSIKSKGPKRSSVVKAVDCRTNLTSQLEGEKQNSQKVSEQLAKKIKALYKHADLKDFCISVQRCAVPKGFEENNEPQVGSKPSEMSKMKEYISTTLLKLKNIQSIKDQFEHFKPAISDTRTSASRDVANQNFINKTNLINSNAVGTAEKVKDTYKHLNLKDFTISVQKCAVPPQFYENNIRNSRKIKRKKRAVFTKKKRNKANRMTQRMYDSKAVDTLQGIKVDKMVTPPGEEKNLTFDGGATVSGSLEYGERSVHRTQNSATELKRVSSVKDQYKKFNLKNICISVERCSVPSTLYPNSKNKVPMKEEIETFPVENHGSPDQRKGHPYKTVHMGRIKQTVRGNHVSNNKFSTTIPPNQNEQFVEITNKNLKKSKRRKKSKFLCSVKRKVKRKNNSIRRDRKIPNLQTVVPKMDIKSDISINSELQIVQGEQEGSSTSDIMPILEKEVFQGRNRVEDIADEPPSLRPQVVLNVEGVNKEKLIKKTNKTCLKRKGKVKSANPLKHAQRLVLQNKMMVIDKKVERDMKQCRASSKMSRAGAEIEQLTLLLNSVKLMEKKDEQANGKPFRFFRGCLVNNWCQKLFSREDLMDGDTEQTNDIPLLNGLVNSVFEQKTCVRETCLLNSQQLHTSVSDLDNVVNDVSTNSSTRCLQEDNESRESNPNYCSKNNKNNIESLKPLLVKSLQRSSALEPFTGQEKLKSSLIKSEPSGTTEKGHETMEDSVERKDSSGPNQIIRLKFDVGEDMMISDESVGISPNNTAKLPVDSIASSKITERLDMPENSERCHKESDATANIHNKNRPESLKDILLNTLVVGKENSKDQIIEKIYDSLPKQNQKHRLSKNQLNDLDSNIQYNNRGKNNEGGKYAEELKAFTLLDKSCDTESSSSNVTYTKLTLEEPENYISERESQGDSKQSDASCVSIGNVPNENHSNKIGSWKNNLLKTLQKLNRVKPILQQGHLKERVIECEIRIRNTATRKQMGNTPPESHLENSESNEDTTDTNTNDCYEDEADFNIAVEIPRMLQKRNMTSSDNEEPHNDFRDTLKARWSNIIKETV